MDKKFSEMEGLARGQLRNLLAATESVGEDDGGRAGGLNGWQQALIGNGFGDFKFAGFEAEGACHSAAAGLDGLDCGARFAEKRHFAGWTAEDGLVMAVAVNEDVRALKAADSKFRRAISEPVREQPDLPAQEPGAAIVGEELRQFIFEDAGAARLEEDEGQASLDLRGHAVEDAREIGAGRAEKTEIVERAPAADVAARNFDLKSGLSEDGLGSCECLRMVVVVPCIGPEQDWPSSHLRWGRVLDGFCGCAR